MTLLALLPRELVAPVSARLGKYVLRAKVKLADDSAAWRITALFGGEPAGAATLALPAAAGELARSGEQLVACLSGAPARYLLVAPHTAAAPSGLGRRRARGLAAAGDRRRRSRRCTRATSEEFVAQMLNLDLLDAIAFDKGCYTGQEVIARAHYRGRVKRRLQRFLSAAPRDARAGRGRHVRRRAHLQGGGRRGARRRPLRIPGRHRTRRRRGRRDAVRAQPVLAAEPLPLPYALPD